MWRNCPAKSANFSAKLGIFLYLLKHLQLSIVYVELNLKHKLRSYFLGISLISSIIYTLIKPFSQNA